jgi:hypothetical protein
MRWIGLCVVMAGTLLGDSGTATVPRGSAPEGAPSVDEIVERLIRRAESVAGSTNGIHYSWRRLTVIEDLDSQGRVEERRTKEHAVVGNAGVQKATLIRVNNQALAARDRDREQRRESENRDKYSRRSDRRGSVEIDEALVRRFRFQWLSNELVEGRWSHVLAFEPKDGQESGRIADRVIGSLKGWVWVDAEVYEVGRIDAILQQSVRVGGFIAELSDLEFFIQRRPLPTGDWVNVKLESRVSGRKLFDRFRGRMEVVQEQFEPLSPDFGGGGVLGATPESLP